MIKLLYFLRYVPKAFRDRELCWKAIKNRCSLFLVPEEHRDREMCLEALKHDSGATRFFPDSLKETLTITEMANLEIKVLKDWSELLIDFRNEIATLATKTKNS